MPSNAKLISVHMDYFVEPSIP